MIRIVAGRRPPAFTRYLRRFVGERPGLAPVRATRAGKQASKTRRQPRDRPRGGAGRRLGAQSLDGRDPQDLSTPFVDGSYKRTLWRDTARHEASAALPGGVRRHGLRHGSVGPSPPPRRRARRERVDGLERQHWLQTLKASRERGHRRPALSGGAGPAEAGARRRGVGLVLRGVEDRGSGSSPEDSSPGARPGLVEYRLAGEDRSGASNKVAQSGRPTTKQSGPQQQCAIESVGAPWPRRVADTGRTR